MEVPMDSPVTTARTDRSDVRKRVDFANIADVAVIKQKFSSKHSKRHRRKMSGRPRLSPFERRYSKLQESHGIPQSRRIDYVLIYPNLTSEAENDPKKKRDLERHERNREKFMKLMAKEGIQTQIEKSEGFVYVKLHATFKRLCYEAERVNIEMPIENYVDEYGELIKLTNEDEPAQNFLERFQEKHFATDLDVEDYVSTAFDMDKINKFKSWEDPPNFFKPALRSFLVNHILINLDIRTEQELHETEDNDEGEDERCLCLPGCLRSVLCCCSSKGKEKPKTAADQQAARGLKKKGLPWLIMKGSYTDFLVLHQNSPKEDGKGYINNNLHVSEDDKDEVKVIDSKDRRAYLNETWTKITKYQPLWTIRDYFGEKIGFYFAWIGLLITTLWIPTIFGLICFFYGLQVRISDDSSFTTPAENITSAAGAEKDLLGDVKRAFDNDITPFFALFICCWGTVFLELWKRTNATLAYEWDVDQFEANEPDRPQFFGTKEKKDPVTHEQMWYYPGKKQMMKVLTSCSVLFFMTSLVIISVVTVIVYRVIMNIDYCPSLGDNMCFLLTTLVSSILNAGSILLLGKIYDKLAVVLTDWENHRTQTRYDDALIIKLFAFQFVNSYASCFYIAFFRGRFSIFEDRYVDDCEGSCMTQLSFQVMILMLAKPFPKFLKDIILPKVMAMWSRRPNCLRCYCLPCFKKPDNKVSDVEATEMDEEELSAREQSIKWLERERLKPDTGDFTLGEYTEKVILYGFLMLFASSFPLAPLLALLICMADIRIDAKRLLWLDRRPIALVAQDIGMWYSILEMVNFIGVITNGFIIAFTSNWGSKFDLAGKLWVIIAFEHIVFGLKFLLAYLIPDTPQSVRIAIRREKFLIDTIFNDKKTKTNNYELIPSDIGPIDEEDEDDDIEVQSSSSSPANVAAAIHKRQTSSHQTSKPLAPSKETTWEINAGKPAKNQPYYRETDTPPTPNQDSLYGRPR